MPGTTPAYWMGESDEGVATMLAVLAEQHDNTEGE